MRIKNNKLKKVILAFIFLNLILINLPGVLSEINIYKSIPSEIFYTSEITEVNLKIINNGSLEISGILYDLPPEFVEVVDGQKEVEEFGMGNYVQKFELKLLPKEEFSANYKINFSRVPEGFLNKDIGLGKAKFIDDNGEEYLSNNANIIIKTNKNLTCNYNYKCESKLGENHENCLQDCLSGMSDNYCDKLKDERCDEDCGIFEDKDCFNQKLGNYKIYLAVIIILIMIMSILTYKKFKS